MKKLTTIILMIVSISAFSQTKKDTIPQKKDTVTVVIVERTDTLRYSFTCVYPGSSVVNYVENGYVIIKGLSSTPKKPYTWAENPTITYAFDDKKRPVKKIVQIMQ
jgi:hypothetical protein